MLLTNLLDVWWNDVDSLVNLSRLNIKDEVRSVTSSRRGGGDFGMQTAIRSSHSCSTTPSERSWKPHLIPRKRRENQVNRESITALTFFLHSSFLRKECFFLLFLPKPIGFSLLNWLTCATPLYTSLHPSNALSCSMTAIFCGCTNLFVNGHINYSFCCRGEETLKHYLLHIIENHQISAFWRLLINVKLCTPALSKMNEKPNFIIMIKFYSKH